MSLERLPAGLLWDTSRTGRFHLHRDDMGAENPHV
jgi:hypothetical protein